MGEKRKGNPKYKRVWRDNIGKWIYVLRHKSEKRKIKEKKNKNKKIEKEAQKNWEKYKRGEIKQEQFEILSKVQKWKLNDKIEQMFDEKRKQKAIKSAKTRAINKAKKEDRI